jgi:Fe-S cluster assembly protein SufD
MSTQTAVEKPAFELKLLENISIPVQSEDLRTKAMDAFVKLGFPTKRHEDWRYTDLSGILKKDWKLEADEAELDNQAILDRLIPNMAANIMVFVNGRFSKEHSVIIEKDPVVIIAPLSEADESIFDAHFGRYAGFEKEGTVALNTAMAAEGLFVHIPDGKNLSAPVHALFFHTEDVFAQYHNLIIVGKNAEGNVIEGTYGLNDDAFTNIVTEIAADQNSRFNYYKLQHESEGAAQVNLTQFHQQKDSLCNSYTFNFSGKLLRNDLNYTLADKKCESHLYGLYIPTDDEHFDNHTFVDHAMPDCFSNELYKGIMNGRSTAVFNGKILVRQDAQKTNAYQSNKNVLLSPDAKVDTKPQLEIFADDVKCSHGATVGQLNEEAIFYLRSRGIAEHAARTMLTFAFAEETLDTIRIEPLKEYLAQKIEEKLSMSL